MTIKTNAPVVAPRAAAAQPATPKTSSETLDAAMKAIRSVPAQDRDAFIENDWNRLTRGSQKTAGAGGELRYRIDGANDDGTHRYVAMDKHEHRQWWDAEERREPTPAEVTERERRSGF